MTVWRKLEENELYAVAIYNYAGTAPHLSLAVGDLVSIERETSHWYWGKSLRKDIEGAFPKSYVTVRPCHVDRCGDTILASAGGGGGVGGGGVVHDIAVTLREWLPIWKELYTSNDDRFKFMEVSMRALLELRAQAASEALPQDQLRRVARTAVFTIDKGNRTLGRELVVRSTGGHLVDPNTTSVYKLNALHLETNSRIDKNMESTPTTPPPTPPPTVRSYSICVKIHNFVCRMTDGAELLLALYDSGPTKLTEHLMLRCAPRGLVPAQVVFTDLASDIKREKVFLVCHVVRIGSMDGGQNNDNRRSSISPAPTPPQGAMRRPFGVACVDITRFLSENNDKHRQVPFYPCDKDKMDTLLKQVISNQRELKDAKHSQGLWVSLQIVEGDLKQIREENPHLVVGNTAVARKMGFPEVILPGDARNDLYVTLTCGSFSKGGGKSSERNIELCARVVDKHGRTLPGVISTGAGVPYVDEYVSLVYYHEDKPRWQETFKVCLNIEAFKEAHLVFLCRHRSSNEAKDRAERHFALAYLRLMQREGTTTPDGQHELCVYKIDSKKSNSTEVETEAAALCLGLPATRDSLPAGAERGLTRGCLSLIHKDSLTVNTKLCSTKLTQREEILGVLKWSTHHAEGNLRQALQRLLHVPSEEIVKFLQDILDALFSILTQVNEEQEGFTDKSYSVLVLECLLHVISLVGDHKYQHFQPVLHVYIDDSFCDAAAYEKLIAVMVWVITTAEDGETKRLLQCMKCLECLVRIIARSRQLRSALDQAATTDFKYQFESLLEALVWLMRCGDHALTCQGCALKYLPHAVPHAIAVYPEKELSAYIAHCLTALPLGRLSKQRMLALLELVKGPLGIEPEARAMLLPHVATTVKALLKGKAEWDREAAVKSRSVDKAARLLGADCAKIHDIDQHKHEVVLCIETLGEIVSLLSRDDVGPVEADKTELAKRLLPTVLKTAASMLKDRPKEDDKDDPMLRQIVCVLLDMVRQMSLDQYTIVVKALEADPTGGQVSLVTDALSLIQALLQRPVFKQYWADMLMLQHSVMIHALRLISTTLCDRLRSVDETDTEAVTAIRSLWQEWFEACTAVATSVPLQLELLTVARKQRVQTLYGDLRRDAAEIMVQMWYSLDDHKRAFIPCLVGPFLEVSFLRDDEVRNTTIPVFYDMMQTEFKTASEGDENPLKELESALIDKIDVLAERGCGDRQWRAKFVTLCGTLSAHAHAHNPHATDLVCICARQLDTLLQYRTTALRSATPHRMHLTTRVLDFYDQIKKRHMYIRYVHKLAQMHREVNQWAEAGLSLRLHADLLSWTYDPLPQRLRHPLQHDHESPRDLKESLFLEIAELLNRGHQWEIAVEIVKELVSVYEAEAQGYGPLAELHQQLATLYNCMLRTPRSHPGYYRVLYHGKGFPEHLRVPHGFVYRGNEYEQFQEFKERLLDEWPEAEILAKLDPPGEDVTEHDGQLMGDKLKRLSGKPVAEQILEYYKHNQVRKFVFNRPFHRPEESLEGSTDDVSTQNEFATRWLERTELEISDTLPGVLRWFPVISQRTYWVSPLEAAVESLQDTNRTLKQLILATKSPDAPLQPLTMRLSGILDPAVQGGIVNYEKAFLTPSYLTKHPNDEALLAELKSLIADQVPLLKFGLEVHGGRAPPALEGLHTHMLGCFKRIQHHVHQRYGRKACDFEPDTPEVQLRITQRDSTQTEPGTSSNHRISDISTGNDSTSKKFFSFNSAINPLALRNSSGGVVSYFGTLQSSPRRRDKRRARKSEVGTQVVSGSQWYTSASTPNGSITAHNSINLTNSLNNSLTSVSPSEGPSASPLRELRQELVTERPLRAEAERERRLSQRASSLLNSSAPPSNRDSMGTTDSNQDDDEPPPLPQKARALDHDSENNNRQESNQLPVRYNYDTVWSPRGSFLYNSLAQRRNTADSLTIGGSVGNQSQDPPTPPPKKKHTVH